MIVDSRKAMEREHAWKRSMVNGFLRGATIADLSTQAACHKLRVEQAIREALVGLIVRVQQPQPADPEVVAAMQSEIDAAAGAPQEPA